MTPPMTVTELVAKAPGAHARLCDHFGPEIVARLLDLEREMLALLQRELPDADAEQRAVQASGLAHAIATDGPWFSTLMHPRPGKVANALKTAHKAAVALLKALDELPPAAVYGVHMRLLGIDLPPALKRQALHRELVYRTVGKVDAGLNSRKAAVAEIALAAAETREGARAEKGNKHRAARLARCVAAAFEGAAARVTVSGTGEGAYPRVVAAVLEAAGVRDASPADVARREAEHRRSAALHSGENVRERAKISTRPPPKM